MSSLKIVFALAVMAFIGVQGQLICTNLPNALSNRDTRSCNCLPGFFWNRIQCKIDCKLIANSNGQAKSLNSCFCVSGYAWGNGTCQITCDRIPNALENFNATSCVCDEGWTWMNSSCLNASNITNNTNKGKVCSRFPFTTGPNGLGGCLCIEYYNWDNATSTCVPDCSQIPGASGPGPILWSCSCLDGFFWNGANCQRNCSALAEAIENTDAFNCSCNNDDDYQRTWNGTFCELEICKNMTLTTGYTNSQGNCICGQEHFNNIVLTEFCGVNCTYTNTSSVCQCINGFAWNGTSCIAE